MRLDDDVKLLWPRNRFTTCDFSQLFDGDWEVDSVPEGADTRFSERLLVLESDGIPEGFAQEHPDKKFENGKLRKKIEVNNGQNIDHEYERIPEKVRESYIQQAKKLVPAEYIRNQLEEFSSENFDENTVSVHMRSWADDPRRQCLFDFNNYFKYMDEMTDKKFFVCADHQHCIDVLKERYPHRVFDYPKRGDGNYSPGTSYMSTLEASQDAIIEMYLLGMNPTILGSYLSTFVEVGWWLNECKGKVVIV
tara:strand:- start:14970 stop:15719 length:750 start_codon:yes stop_codon:yes gene_type:complete